METRWVLTEQELPEASTEVWAALDDETVLDSRVYLSDFDGWIYSGEGDIPCQSPKWWAPIVEQPPASPRGRGWKPDSIDARGDIRWCWDGKRVFRGDRKFDGWYEYGRLVVVLMWQEVRSRQAPSAP